ncbi:hypothetical protein [Paraburkholderia sp. J76]|uniref:hypothetical protein n=1 Tax=Paraburkholderia sp. J76 TaxID=2805439 RepID=UPI002ABD5971|nr:hypothetical protein [Paraburkholderia sp. J76]
MKTLPHLTYAALLCASAACPVAMAQGTGPSPYGSELGQHTTAPGSKGDQQHKARSHGGAAHPKEASAPRANPAEDTGAK